MARILRLLAGTLLVSLVQASAADDPRTLPLLREAQPRAFFFRQAEGMAAQGRMPYEQWSRTFGRLMGVMGKVLDEELPGRSGGLDTFVRFKREHPEQTVLLHLNGNSRDPRYEGSRFFAGHWLYHNGATVLSAVPAEPGETTLRVSDATLFVTGGGRYRNSNDDIGFCAVGADGRPDWTRAEQVQLLSIDRAARTIRVRRGAFGTAPRAFAAGQAYAAAHCSEGPWGAQSNLLWNYNYSTTCPRDAAGRTCADVFVQHLSELFHGPLASFDGLEFDVLFNVPSGAGRRNRGADCDADGTRDNGVVGGVNVYGNGVTEFCRRLRAALGDGKLILADGAFRNDTEQRASGSLNGIESEGWPVLSDFKMDDWSGGLNRHEFWRAFGRAPVLNYFNVKFVEPGEPAARPQQADVPFGSIRLAFAGAVFTDSAITFSHRPAAPNGGVAIWDELIAGTEARLGWLGRAKGPARHLADDATAVLPSADAWQQQMQSSDATLSTDGNALRVEAKKSTAASSLVALKLPLAGADLCVKVVTRSAAMRHAAPETARLVHAAIAGAEVAASSSPSIMSWTGRQDFTSRFYFRHAPKGGELRLTFESAEPVWITSIAVHAAPDLVVREFEHGAVLANPSDAPQTFELAQLFPRRAWRRLHGTSGQDEKTNNGEPTGASVVVPARDALFLEATDH